MRVVSRPSPGRTTICHIAPYRSVSLWCKGRNDGIGRRALAVCGAKPSHHRRQMHAFQCHGVCLCTTEEDVVFNATLRPDIPRRTISSGGAKAHVTRLEDVRLPSVVRTLRTIHGKRTRSNATVCAFAPPRKIWCSTHHYDPRGSRSR